MWHKIGYTAYLICMLAINYIFWYPNKLDAYLPVHHNTHSVLTGRIMISIIDVIIIVLASLFIHEYCYRRKINGE